MTFPVKAVVLDWAGTMVDFGCRAPVLALRQLFEQAGVPISEAEARVDMGRAKRDHISAILAMPRVAAVWKQVHGARPGDKDADSLHEQVEPIMRNAARECAALVPGAAAFADALRAKGIPIGSCTGYTRAMMADILPYAAEQGYAPDVVVCAGETPLGRPSPFMLWRALSDLKVWPASATIKIDDAPVGIAEGRGAGAWTIGLSASGNGVGLDRAALEALPEEERRRRVENAGHALRAAGADYVVESIAAALPVVEQIARRLEAGDRR